MQTRKNNAPSAGRSTASGKANANTGRPQNQDRRRQAKKKPVSQIDPALLTKKAIAKPSAQAEAPVASVPFARLALPEILLTNVRRKGYEVLTPIQEKAIPALLEGQDVLALSRTGSGKTAAFLLPLITKLMKRPALRSALILTPTRELALQIEEEFKSLSAGTNLRVATFIGGTSLPQDLRKCQARQEVLIATPGAYWTW
nr:DEAD/DEAH box helicase [Nitritalea halalkaliphila]